MAVWICLLILLSWKQYLVGGIRLVELRVPTHVPEGGSALLGCEFDMEGDELYSVKWYKDGREFYRYVPSNRIPTRRFSTPGVVVDVSRSSSTVLALTKLKQQSAGIYRCEVSGEAPKFTTVHDEKYITIQYLPKTGPRIEGVRDDYDFGDRAELNCTSYGSRPEAQLKWLINNIPVRKEHLRGPWTRISQERMDTMDTTLELRFTVMPRHFNKGVLTIKCQAVIAPLYQEETVHQISWDHDIYSTIAPPFEITEESLSLSSPVYEIPSFGIPPFDEYTSEERIEKVSVDHAEMPHGNGLLLILVLLRLML